MASMLNDSGIFGTKAPLISDVTLILILVSAALFTIGWQLAVRKRFQAHRWVQTAAVILNTLVVLVVMINSFIKNVAPGIPGNLSQTGFAVPTVHGIIGAIGLVFGVFVDLRGNNLVPKALQFRNYKLFMRTSYALYMLATLVGVVVYIVLYG